MSDSAYQMTNRLNDLDLIVTAAAVKHYLAHQISIGACPEGPTAKSCERILQSLLDQSTQEDAG